MEYGNLVCNFKDCYKELKDTVYVTFCSHIVCAQHGEKMKLNVPGVCLVCKESLEGHQIVEQNLKITKNSIKLLLCGQNPKTIVEAANSSLSFWNYQKKHEYLDMKRSLDSYKTKLQIQTKAMDEMTKEKDSQISSLMMENEKLLKEKVSLKVEVASLTEENQEVKKQRTH